MLRAPLSFFFVGTFRTVSVAQQLRVAVHISFHTPAALDCCPRPGGGSAPAGASERHPILYQRPASNPAGVVRMPLPEACCAAPAVALARGRLPPGCHPDANRRIAADHDHERSQKVDSPGGSTLHHHIDRGCCCYCRDNELGIYPALTMPASALADEYHRCTRRNWVQREARLRRTATRCRKMTIPARLRKSGRSSWCLLWLGRTRVREESHRAAADTICPQGSS
jgi:hypothetical protein